MDAIRAGVVATLLLAGGCHEPYPAGPAALNGAYGGVVSEPGAPHSSGEMLVLDGLMLGYDYDRSGSYSALLDVGAGAIDGSMQSRDADGHVRHDFGVAGAWFDDGSIELEETGGYADGAQVTLFRKASLSDDSFARHDLDGVYAMYGPDLDATLIIGPDGSIEAYDEFGCSYFGYITSPDRRVNVHEVSLDMDGCGHDYAIGLATLDRTGHAPDELVLSLWFDRDDRVETWVMERH